MNTLTFADDGSECLAVFGIFRDRFAKVERLACPIVDGEREMVGSDGARDSGTQALDGFHRFLRCGMFQNDAQARKVPVEGLEMVEKVSFRVEDACILMEKPDELGAGEG